MSHNETPVARFLHHYEQINSSKDVAALVALFADTFMAANPQGAQCVRAEDFAHMLPKRIQLFQSYGCESTSLVSFAETRLDDRFAMAETRWRMTFRREGQPAQDAFADGLYILDMSGDAPRIVFYLAHQDYMAILNGSGIPLR